ncbi:Serpentine Receptor, class U [Caenorhabditis elegans]|uniref:Serpentine Receptor, class U n=1 Tax=Caenorhabditis elegans TaxID=6239 RepID=Q9XXR7_CAEEL|nr:Serpentine Receptor, class U [Caenorhabditis elegans]CAA16361.2 Serpentine Receptor, class U [Caenorhabditis elegans]|eukprot:NP_502620.2 Serpentine Receptor, class U [Caenorhabditis elegans]
MELLNNVSIQGDPRYINYKFEFFTFPVFLALVPFTYVIPTTVIVSKICICYFKNPSGNRNGTMNPHVFLVIAISQITSIFYMISDYLTTRIPFTGAITSWCASQQPNHLLKVLFFFSTYFTYTGWIFPFLLTTLRLVSLYYPFNQDELCARITQLSIPFIYIWPLFFTFTLFPALGFCRQILGPYQFGAIYFWFSGNLFDIKLIKGLIGNLLFWFILCTTSTLMLFIKLEKMKNQRNSALVQKAELSLSLTTLSMLFSFIFHFVGGLIFIINPYYTAYFIALRPYGNDIEFVVVPWIFYSTHPIFKKQSVVADGASRIGSVQTTF